MNKHTGLFEEWGSKVIVMYQRETERKLKEQGAARQLELDCIRC
jgi:hypothetical protein